MNTHHKHHKGSPADSGLQEGIHSAIDIGFSLAGLIGGLFGDAKFKHALQRADEEGAGIFLQLSPNSTAAQPIPQIVLNQNSTNSLLAMIIPATTQVPKSGLTTDGPLYASPILLSPTLASHDFMELPDFTKGLFTAALVDGSNPQELVPLCGLTARGALMGAQGVPLISQPASGGNPPNPLLTFNITPSDPSIDGDTGSITLVNNHSVPLSASFTMMTADPNQSFTLPFAVIQPAEQSTLQFPVPLSQSTTFAQLNAVAFGSASALTQLAPG